MSELVTREPLTPQAYLEFVVNSRFKNTGDDWKLNSATFLSEEFLEALTQHGGREAITVLLPEESLPGFTPEDISAETRYAMADEIGDSLWFMTDALSRENLTIEGACVAGFQAHGIKIGGDLSFDEIQNLAVNNADSIRYVSKAGLIMGYRSLDDAPDHFTTSLRQNPLVILTRTTRRVTRALEEGTRDMAPYASAAEHEPVADLNVAIGQNIITLAYILKSRLGVTLGGVAEFNRDKLVHRDKYGKPNDIHFSEQYATL